MRVKSLFIDGSAQSPEINQAATEISELECVDEVILLPDAHVKNKYKISDRMEVVPSSCVIVTDGEKIYPQFRSRGLGCGMIVIRTGIILDELPNQGKKLISKLKLYFSNDQLATELTSSSGRQSLGVTPLDMKMMCIEGAPWVCREFGVNLSNTDMFFNNGRYSTDDDFKDFPWDRISSDWLNGKARDGKLLGLDVEGNHFLEAQIVTSIPGDTDSSLLLKGELVFLYHGSCNGLSRLLKPDTYDHLTLSTGFKSFSKDDWEYDFVLAASKLLMNWSAACRCLVIARIKSLFYKIDKKIDLGSIQCVTESPHNTITLESVRGETKLVYRHNATTLSPNYPSIVSGRHDIPTLLYTAGDSPENSCCSLDHGVGNFVSANKELVSIPTKDKSTLLEKLTLGTINFPPKSRNNVISDFSILKDSLSSLYSENGLVEDRYELRPLLTLKRKIVRSKKAILKHILGWS